MNETKAEERKHRLLKCIYFNGLINKKCEKGIDYIEIRDNFSNPFLYPCLPDGVHLKCPLREYKTEQQLDEEDKDFATMLQNMFTVRKIITDKHQGKRNVDGFLNCPICKVGKVGYSIAYNGHIHATCITAKCVNWIE